MTVDNPVEHGFSLDRADHRLLRGRPPAYALAWLISAVGPGTRIKMVRALPGGTSSAVHLVLAMDPMDPTARPRRLVLRRYVRADWLAEEPDLAEREAEVLRLLAASPVPTPEFVAVDPSGEQTDVPAVLMTALPGRIRWDRAVQDPWLHRLAELLPAIHATPIPDTSQVRRYQPAYHGKQLRPPAWTRHPRAWQRAVEIYHQPPAPTEEVLIHRDYHPGNVLWTRGKATGVVDWATASRGTPEADVGHCRANLLGADTAAADRFLAAYQDVSGRHGYHPYWDIAACIDLSHSCDAPDLVLDNWLVAAVAALA